MSYGLSGRISQREERTARILIVDDDPDFLFVSRTILEAGGYQVMTAANGRQALEVMRQNRPDLVLLDMMLSTTLEGLDVGQEMKADPNLARVPVVMISSITAGEYAAGLPAGEQVPADAWLSKPIQPAVLLKTIGQFLASER